MECTRYKDFIHVHSFMHDFHLRFLLSLLSGTRQPPENFDIRRLLRLFRLHNKVPPNFIRSRLCKGEQLPSGQYLTDLILLFKHWMATSSSLVLLPWQPRPCSTLSTHFLATLSPPLQIASVYPLLWTHLTSTVILLHTVEYLAWRHLSCVLVLPALTPPTRKFASSLMSPPIPSALPPPPNSPGCSKTFRRATPSGKPSLDLSSLS